jgi:opacity protein-like surface antigen
MKKMFLLLSCGVLLFSSSAEAFKFPCRNGPYISAYFGGNYINNFKLKRPANEERSFCRNYKLNCGGVGALAIGYNFCNAWRLEEEGAYRWNSLKGQHHASGHKNRSGHYQMATAFTNLYLDLPRMSCWAIKPYVGAGIGYAWCQLKSQKAREFNGTHGGFAWQFITGLTTSFCVNYDYFFDFRYVTNRAQKNTGHHVGSYSFGVGVRRYF